MTIATERKAKKMCEELGVKYHPLENFEGEVVEVILTLAELEQIHAQHDWA